MRGRVGFTERKEDPILHPGATHGLRMEYEVFDALCVFRSCLCMKLLVSRVDGGTYVVEIAFSSCAVIATRIFSFSSAASDARFSADFSSSELMTTE